MASIVGGLLVTTFLILFVASTAVVGSMLVLALSDLVVSRKRPSDVTNAMLDAKLAHIPDLEEAMSNWRRERNVEAGDYVMTRPSAT